MSSGLSQADRGANGAIMEDTTGACRGQGLGRVREQTGEGEVKEVILSCTEDGRNPRLFSRERGRASGEVRACKGKSALGSGVGRADLPAVGTRSLQTVITSAAQGRGRMEDGRNSGRKKTLCSTKVHDGSNVPGWDIYSNVYTVFPCLTIYPMHILTFNDIITCNFNYIINI